MRLLIVEDEKKLCIKIADNLRRIGYEVDECYDGECALSMFYSENYDLIILDLNIPYIDGMSLLKMIRKDNKEVKIIILSARSNIEDKVDGLDAGANDYMEKPFHLEELYARIRRLIRRKFIQNDTCITCKQVSFDTKNRITHINKEIINLTRKESGILEYLLLNQGRPISQEELIEHVWDSSVDSFSGSVRVHMSSLRKKIKSVLGYDPIINKIGEGYIIGGNE